MIKKRRGKGMKKKEVIILIILTVLLAPVLSHADYFVVMRNGDVRSGPGTNHPIVGSVKGSEVFEIPTSFKYKQNVTWIPIEWREAPKTVKVRGWRQIVTHTEYMRGGEVVEGWYLVGPEDLRTVEPGQIVYFIMENDPDEMYHGEVLVKLTGEKMIEGLLYRNAKFRLTQRIPKEVEIEPEIGGFHWFYTGGCQGETSTGSLLERLPDRKTCLGRTYELGLFKVDEGFETFYTKWVDVSLGERVSEPDVARRLYQIRKSGFPLSVQEDILNRRIWKGMTKKMARLSWGEPSWTNTTSSMQGRGEKWTYNYGRTIYYLYFTDGKLDSYRRVR